MIFHFAGPLISVIFLFSCVYTIQDIGYRIQGTRGPRTKGGSLTWRDVEVPFSIHGWQHFQWRGFLKLHARHKQRSARYSFHKVRINKKWDIFLYSLHTSLLCRFNSWWEKVERSYQNVECITKGDVTEFGVVWLKHSF